MAADDRVGSLLVRGAPLLAALVVMVPVAMLAATHRWDGLYGQDAFFYHAYATGELRSAMAEGRAPGPFTWPPGYPVAAAVASLAVGPGSLSGQIVSLVAAASIPLLVWMLSRELSPERPAWVPALAALVAASSPHLWQSGAVVMADTTALAASTLGAWALARWSRGGDRWWLALAAGSVAAAVVTRWAAAVPGAVLAITGLLVARQRRRLPTWTGVMRELGPALLMAGVVLIPVVGPMAWAALRSEMMPFSIALASHDWDVANLLRTTVVTSDGQLSYSLPMLTFFLLEPARFYHLGPALAALAVVGGAAVLARRVLVPVMIVVAWPVVTVVALAGDGYQNTRFALLLLPPMAVAAAIGVAAVAAAVARRAGTLRRAVTVMVVGGVGIALAIQLVGAWHFTDDFIGRFREDRAAIASLAERVPPGGRLISFGATLALRHGGRTVTELSDLTVADAERLLADGAASWLVVPRGAPDDQWRDTPQGATLTVLLADPRMELLAQDGGWSLWHAGQGRQEAMR